MGQIPIAIPKYIIKKRAELAFTSAEVRHAPKSCSRGQFYAISYTLKTQFQSQNAKHSATETD